MKKIMMIAAMMVATLSASAQNEVGQITLKPTVGLNIATMTKGTNTKVRPGFIAGVEGEYGVSEKFGLTAGVFYSQQGVKGKDVNVGEYFLDSDYDIIGGWEFDGDITVKLDYINVPIMAQYYLIPGLAVKAGAQFGFNVLKKAYLKGTAYQGSVQGGNVRSLDETRSLNGEGIKSFQFAVPVGLSYEYKSFVLDARYNIYATKAFKDADSRHSVFSVTLGYKFAL